MKKLSKLVLNDHSSIMNDRDMKRIVGGDGYTSACAASTTATGTARCVDNDIEAIRVAGANGWWCCNCQEAFNVCGVKPVYYYE